jgi:Family of unknown function (DUF5681)
MTDISLQKTAKAARRGRGRPFQKGQSGNPAGRPRGSTNRATRAAELLLDGEAEALSRKAIELALAGDDAIVRHRESVEAHNDAKVWSVEFGVLQVWQKQDSQWRLLARQGWKT